MAGMESFQLLNMDEDEDIDLSQVPKDQNGGRRERAGDLVKRTSDGSLESLHFDFANSAQGVRLAHPKSWITRAKVWMMVGLLACLCMVTGFLACKGQALYGQAVNDHPVKENWKDKLRFTPDFARCPAGFADRPVVIVISMDGLRADLVEQMPNLQTVAKAGLHAPHMRPVFPSATFPNHYSIVTGLHPESHGIIDNRFLSANLSDTFLMYMDAVRFNPAWWKGRPIWEVAQEQGRRVATHYWPGSDVAINGVRPTVYMPIYSSKETVESRAQFVLDQLQLPRDRKPHLILTYYQQPDDTAHGMGTSGPAFKAALASADRLAELLMEGLAKNDLMDCVDIMFISDHGVVDDKTSIYPVAALKEKLGDDAKKVNIFLGTGFMNRISPGTSDVKVSRIADALACSNDSSPYQVYAKPDLPRRYHFFNTEDIAPVILTANISVQLNRREPELHLNHTAMHGWDNIYSAMRASFIAYGPSFRRNISVEAFQNIELFGLFCQLLGIIPASNNGTQGSLSYLLRSTVSNEMVPLPVSTGYSPVENVDLTVPLQPLPCSSSCIPVSTDVVGSVLNASQAQTNAMMLFHFGALGGPTVHPVEEVSLLANMDFVSGFSRLRGVPLWTAFQLTRATVSVGNVFAKEITCLYHDPRTMAVIDGSQVCESSQLPERQGEIFSQSYLFPPDLASSASNCLSANMSSNAVPMIASFRTGVWRRFWDLVSSWVPNEGSLHVVTGPVFDHHPPFGLADNVDLRRPMPRRRRAPSPAALPSHFFVILSRPVAVPACQAESCRHDVRTFVLPHRPKALHPCQKDRFFFLTHSATVRDVELLTNLQFFSGLSVTEAARLKTRLTNDLWNDIPL